MHTHNLSPSPGMNGMLAALANQRARVNPSAPKPQSEPQLKPMHTDAKVQADLQRIAAQAGPNANVTVQYRFQVGADGELHVVGGTVTSSERVAVDGEGNEVAAGSLARLHSGQDTLSGLTKPKARMSPTEEADLFGLSDEDLSNVKKLQSIDAQVRGHESQHFRTAGGLVSGGPEYTFVQGPDGGFYAVGGEVNVRTTATYDEAKASRDAATLGRAATAPADTSAQDIAAARHFYNDTASLFRSAANAQPQFFDIAA